MGSVGKKNVNVMLECYIFHIRAYTVHTLSENWAYDSKRSRERIMVLAFSRICHKQTLLLSNCGSPFPDNSAYTNE